jgi:hypothetical protein
MRLALLIFQMMFLIVLYITVLVIIALYSEIMAGLFAVQTILIFLIYYVMHTEIKLIRSF